MRKMAATVFIDGEVGTTGLQIHGRLAARRDVELLHLSESERKDPQRRQAMPQQVHGQDGELQAPARREEGRPQPPRRRRRLVVLS